ncbi:MAG: EAL domain-containing protein, partial [Pseudomonadota bacterium]|nr:EAL domain-containing protein [Pseudomonadota bacterium]
QQLEQLLFCSINVSAAAISDNHFLKTLMRLIEHTQIPTEKLCFEISEPTAITYLTGAIEFMTTLKQIGCQLILDDFGTGLSSFAYLKQLPVDFLKIDSALVNTLATDAIDEALVKAINDIAQLMGLKTIAEGVENQIIFDKLKIIGVDYVQGYWLSEPQALAP